MRKQSEIESKHFFYVDEDGIPAFERELEEQYNEMLDDCYPVIDICGMKYCPSTALYRTDKIAYDAGLSEYIDSCGYTETYMTLSEARKLRGG